VLPNDEISVGIVPVNELKDITLYCNEVKYPISVGIVPLSEFPENLKV